VIIRDIGDSQLAPDYGVLFQQIYPIGGEDLADWGVGRCVIEAGGQTAPHGHDEHEMFLVLEGAGEMDIDGERAALTAGQAVAIPAGSRHYLRNASDQARLVFINVYWPPSVSPLDI